MGASPVMSTLEMAAACFLVGASALIGGAKPELVRLGPLWEIVVHPSIHRKHLTL